MQYGPPDERISAVLASIHGQSSRAVLLRVRFRLGALASASTPGLFGQKWLDSASENAKSCPVSDSFSLWRPLYVDVESDDGLHGSHISAEHRADLLDGVIADFGVDVDEFAIGDRRVLELEALADDVGVDLEHELA